MEDLTIKEWCDSLQGKRIKSVTPLRAEWSANLNSDIYTGVDSRFMNEDIQRLRYYAHAICIEFEDGTDCQIALDIWNYGDSYGISVTE